MNGYKRFYIRHTTITWMIGTLSGLAAAGISSRYPGSLGIAMAVLLLGVSRLAINAYSDWAYTLPRSSDEEV